jgi:DNA helicase-2/ATP-dependent DNA helicase PcrA
VGEIPDELVERHTATSATGWASPAPGVTGAGLGERRQPHASPLQFEVGDDVVHASFGEGVVIGVEAGNVLVVRFAAEAAERKLMADYAPLRRAG